METAYDRVAYPTILHRPTNPERLGVAARLAGLDPVPMAEARVLEIGGGNCFGLIAFASIWPTCSAHGFDLAPSAIERGHELAEGCANVTLAVEDILTAHQRYAAGSFDYVIAHGVYAWVPEPVRQALLALIAYVLSPRGVAFVSYNALPGGHVRVMLREMVLHAVVGHDEPRERVQAAYDFLQAYAEAEDGDDPLQVALRLQAAELANRPASVLFHDEMGEVYAPQSLSQVVRAGKAAGLRHLTDAGRNRGLDGFLPYDEPDSPDPDATVLYAAQSRDYLRMCYFRATLFVRDDVPLDRRIDPARLDEVWIAAPVKVLGGGEFKHGEDSFSIADPAFAARIEQLASGFPQRRRIGDLVTNDEQRLALLELYRGWMIDPHLGPEPFVLSPGERPRTGDWIRAMLAREEDKIVSLDLRAMTIDQPDLRALLIAADGTRSMAELGALDHGIPADQVEDALKAAASKALLVA